MKDRLTELLDFEGFREAFSSGELYTESDEPAIVFINVADFKSFNRVYGYNTGDEALKFVASLLSLNFPGELIARIGDDHFITTAGSCETLLQSKIDKINSSLADHPDRGLIVKAGLSHIHGSSDIFRACDRARIACEKIGSSHDISLNRYEPSMSREIVLNRYIIDHIDEAIEKEWLTVHYQPVMRIMTNEMSHAEALCRWKDPEHGFISPVDFIPVLEDSRLIWKVDEFVIKKVCSDIRMMLDQHSLPVPISVNLSRQDFDQSLCNIFSYTESCIKETGISRDYLAIEVTESALIENIDDLSTGVKQFHEGGYKLWMDDFGSGYSSLNVLRDYPFDVLKLDRDFILALDEHDSDRTALVLYSILKMAKESGMQTVCEGVETQEALEFIKNLG